MKFKGNLSLYSLLDIDQEMQRGLMRIFLIKYILKAEGSGPGGLKDIYEYIPHST
jgi:hypothetical protein